MGELRGLLNGCDPWVLTASLYTGTIDLEMPNWYTTPGIPHRIRPDEARLLAAALIALATEVERGGPK